MIIKPLQLYSVLWINKNSRPLLGTAVKLFKQPCIYTITMPRHQSGKLLCREVRITPYDQQKIQFPLQESYLKDVTRFILCEEGTPNGNPKLHYHGYIETTKSDTGLRTFLRCLSNPPAGVPNINGNTLYFTRNAHEYTMGYVTKHRNIVLNHGYTQTEIESFFALSESYQKQKDSDRRRENRTRQMELQDVVEEVKKDLHTSTTTKYEPIEIAELILDMCLNKNVRFPTRSQMEYYINQILYINKRKYPVLNYYIRSYI